MMKYEKKTLNQHRRIVIKIGSALLVDQGIGLRHEWLFTLCQDIAELRQAGVEVLLVSSGAIALGRSVAQLSTGRLKLEESQACAAIGQIELAKAYRDALGKFGLQTGQVLLVLDDTEERERYLNARATIETLFRLGVVPVVNENDTVATYEIRYGDNDRLAARVSTMIAADLLILLSDIDGLYTAPPHLDPQAKHIEYIAHITPEIEKMAGATPSGFSRGGMKTKLDAGKIANAAGSAMIIASGKLCHPLKAIDQGAKSSYFAPSTKPVNAWKTWISGHLTPAGFLIVDEGAVAALRSGKSLLAAGVKAVEGTFSRGDTVAVLDENRQEIARGLVSHDKEDTLKIAGLKSEDIEKIFSFDSNSTLIHRNYMVVRQKN